MYWGDCMGAKYDKMKLENQLCFAFYVCSKEIIRKYQDLLKPFNLTYTHYITLLALWEKDDVRVKELGDKLYLDSGTLTPLLKKLEKAGYVTREKSLHDERNVYVKLTAEGWNLRDKMADVPDKIIDRIFENAPQKPKNSSFLLSTVHEINKIMTKKEEND